MRTISDTIKRLPKGDSAEIPSPVFSKNNNESRVVLGVSSMKDHMTDEGWQITYGLSLNGYVHCGYGLDDPETDVRKIIEKHNPGTIVVQDPREWDVHRGDFRDMNARFLNVESMKEDSKTFRVTILKDSHQKNSYQRDHALSMGIHAWIVYYNERIVKHLAPYVRPKHLIRTSHSIDKSIVPEFCDDRKNNCLISGAVSRAYPLRQRIVNARRPLQVVCHKHPGYHRNGSAVPEFLATLNTFKVSICTSSMYGYSLRKLIESTACGCKVITDLPSDEIMPCIEENLIRIDRRQSLVAIRKVIQNAVGDYNYEKQRKIADRAIEHYHYENVCRRLSDDIKKMRETY